MIAPHSLEPWILEWSSPFETHTYEPLYLANGIFGGMLDLSGGDLDLWSSRIGAVPAKAVTGRDSLFPVTALHTRLLFQNAHFRAAGFQVGRSGIHCSDPRYTADPSMPHRPQVYNCEQKLDLRTGIATTAGQLFPGSAQALSAGLTPERVISFRTRVAFLKDSPLLGIEVESAADTEITLVAEPILHEYFKIKGRDRGIHKLGNEIDCDIELRQKCLSAHRDAGRIEYRIEAEAGRPYRVRLSATGGRPTGINGDYGLAVRGRAFFVIEILPHGVAEEEQARSLDADSFFSEQTKRWGAFWSASTIKLPTAEGVWQQRYHASLFNVAQSLGDGPTHPSGLSRPMLPYWIGCFHDTDTYFCRALLETGHGKDAARHLEYRHRLLPKAREIAQAAGRSGALYPWQTDSHGEGDPHDVPVNAAIIAVEAWHHYLHTGTPESLRQAAEILAETLQNLADHLETGNQSMRLAARPIHTFSETMDAVDPTEVRLACRAVALAHLAAGEALGRSSGDSLDALARRIVDGLRPPLHPDGFYAFASQDGEPEYLRCPSVLLGSFPLHCLEADTTLAKTFLHELARIVHLFAWLPHQASVVASQLQISEGSLSASSLLRHADAFYKPWHACDEWENRRAVRAANFVTAAGGFCTALHHMLLAETSAGVWTLFPGIPAEWSDVGFERLHTRAGWRVSAQLTGGRLQRLEVEPVHNNPSRPFVLRLPLGESAPPSSFAVSHGSKVVEGRCMITVS